MIVGLWVAMVEAKEINLMYTGIQETIVCC